MEDTRQFQSEIKESRKTFAESLELCTKKDDKEICEHEELFLTGIMQVLMYLLQQSDEYTLNLLQKKMQQVHLTDAKRYLHNLQSCGFTDDEVKRFYVTATIIGGENFFTSTLLNWVKTKEEGVAKDRVKLCIPVIGMVCSVLLAGGLFLLVGFLVPLILLPTSLLALNSAMYIWRETPGKLLHPLIVILQQKLYLALQGIRVQEFYPSKVPVETNKKQEIRSKIAEKKNRLLKRTLNTTPNRVENEYDIIQNLDDPAATPEYPLPPASVTDSDDPRPLSSHPPIPSPRDSKDFPPTPSPRDSKGLPPIPSSRNSKDLPPIPSPRNSKDLPPTPSPRNSKDLPPIPTIPSEYIHSDSTTNFYPLPGDNSTVTQFAPASGHASQYPPKALPKIPSVPPPTPIDNDNPVIPSYPLPQKELPSVPMPAIPAPVPIGSEEEEEQPSSYIFIDENLPSPPTHSPPPPELYR